MGHHYWWDRFIEEMQREGIHPADAATLPEAQEARAKDRQLDEAETRTKREWPTKLDHFESNEEFRAAMADPAYRVNEHYRAKVHSMLAKSALRLEPTALSRWWMRRTRCLRWPGKKPPSPCTKSWQSKRLTIR